MKFTNTKTFMCRAGIDHWGNSVEINTFESHDAEISAMVFGSAWINNAIVNGRSNNTNTAFGTTQGFQFYDTWTQSIVSNTQFRNFIDNGKGNTYDNNKVFVALTYSDTFKPQGISAVNNITYQNVDRSLYIAHPTQDTGSSRYFNYVDYSGSSVGRNYPVLVGSHSPFWKLDDDCVFEDIWNVWVCKYNVTGRYVANLNFGIPGVIYYDGQPYNNKLGNCSLFGDFDDFRGAPVTHSAGITGATGTNWYMYLNDGAPVKFSIGTYIIPLGSNVIFAMRYPAGTTFNGTCTLNYSSYKKALTAVSSFADLKKGDGLQYFFDNKHLYLKLVDNSVKATDYFGRGGARVYDVNNNFAYSITSSCASSDKTWCDTPVSDLKPAFW